MYALLVDRLERMVFASGDPSVLFDVRADFDAALLAEPKKVDPERKALMDALGLRGAA